jgi:hypothetical protein
MPSATATSGLRLKSVATLLATPASDETATVTTNSQGEAALASRFIILSFETFF